MRKIILLCFALTFAACSPMTSSPIGQWNHDDSFSGHPAISLSARNEIDGQKPTLYIYCNNGNLALVLDVESGISYDVVSKKARIQVEIGENVDAQVKTDDGKVLLFGPEGTAGIIGRIKENSNLAFQMDSKDMENINPEFDASGVSEAIKPIESSCK